MRERFIVPSICSRDVAGAERSDVRRFEHFLELFNVVNDAFNVHAPQSSRKRRLAVNPGKDAQPSTRSAAWGTDLLKWKSFVSMSTTEWLLR